ncbi:MAG: response regulator [Acidobacteriota bacterium]
MKNSETYRDRISLKLLRASLVAAFLAGIFLGTVQLVNDYSTRTRNFDQTLDRILLMAKRSAAQAAYTLDPMLAREVVQGVMEYNFIVKGAVTDQWGNDLASRTVDSPRGRTRWLTRMLTEEYSEIILDLQDPSGREGVIGSMMVKVDRDVALKPFYNRVVFALGSGILVILTLTLLLFGIFYLMITRPLVELASGLGRLDPEEPGKGHLEPLPGHGADELGLVVGTINRFLESSDRHLKEHRRAEEELRAARDELEVRVEERTTELKAAMEEAQAANHTKGEFLARMSHEIRTPMNAIVGMTHLTLQTKLTKKQKGYMDKVDSSALALLRIIDDILDFSKIEADRSELQPVQFVLDDVLKNVSVLIGMTAHKKGLELLYSIDKTVPNHLVGDPVRLGQILINLIGNAVKFTEKGEVVLYARLEDENEEGVTLRFSIQDTGIGISAEQVNDLFEPFTQADGYYTRRYSGTGLGLAICQRLVRMMGGEIQVQSEPGVGSTFTFTAILGRDEERSIETLRILPKLAGLRTLVVDNSETSRLILREMLESFNFDVTLTTSGEEGIAELERVGQSRSFDLVLLDLKAPGDEGALVCDHIKGHSRQAKIPHILMLTESSAVEMEDVAQSARPDGFLEKPVTSSSLFDAIINVFSTELSAAEAVVHPGTDVMESIVGIRGARVLLVEDDEINQQVATELLESVGLVVTAVGNGKKCVELFEGMEEPDFEMILMDIQMPEMDGLEATRRIRTSGKAGAMNMPIVAVTAHAMTGDRERSLEAGMNDHVTKPIDPEHLYATLVKWIEPGEREIPDRPVHRLVDLDRAGTALPIIEGLTIEDGLRRLSGNRMLYRDLLIKFYRNNLTTTSDIEEAMSENDREKAEHLVHTLKGVSGNLGFEVVHLAAASLEKEILHGSGYPKEALFKFKTVMDRIMTSMGQFVSALKEDTTMSPGLKAGEKNLLAGFLQELEPFIKSRKPKGCRSAMERISAYSWPDDYTKDLDSLLKQVKRYRYKEAEKILVLLNSRIKGEETASV